MNNSTLGSLSSSEKLELAQLLEEKLRRQKRRLFFHLFQDEDTTFLGEVFHSRHGYPKHMEFFQAGAAYRERCFMAGNRVGKTVSGGYEIACHATGRYPDWWQGRRFERPIKAWVAGKTNETTRDILQRKLFGDVQRVGPRRRVTGTGIIPGDDIDVASITWKQGVPDLIDKVAVRHVSGGYSEIGVKAYQQGRGAFEGTEQDVIWLDEEPPRDIYGECVIRTATTNGLIMLTFTPLEGMSETVMQFMPQDMRPAA